MSNLFSLFSFFLSFVLFSFSLGGGEGDAPPPPNDASGCIAKLYSTNIILKLFELALIIHDIVSGAIWGMMFCCRFTRLLVLK